MSDVEEINSTLEDEDHADDSNDGERLQIIEDDDSESEDGDGSLSNDYVSEAKNIIYTNDEINIKNALLFNKTMQKNLKEMKAKLEQMLQTCDDKYKANERTIAEMTDQSTTKKSQALNTFYCCGQPFFKDADAFPAPPTADYLSRRRRELFPLDLEERNVFWMARDKIHLINGVKKQVLAHLRTKNNDKIRKLATKRRASTSTRIKEENIDMEQWHLKELFSRITDKDFKINWFVISMEELNGRHTSNECEGMWTGYLMPSLNRKNWTADEEDKLLCLAIQYGAQNWPDVAKQLKNRSPYQCFVHYRTVLSDRMETKNTRWSTEEDTNLVQLVAKYRIGNLIPWTKITSRMPGRCKTQIYNRYMFSLNPDINRGRFTVEEDCVLMAAVKEYGQNFNNFPPNLLPGRSTVQIRSRYNNVLKHVGKREHWTLEHDVHLMTLVAKHGESDWARISEEIRFHNRTSCRSRYMTIAKFLKKHPASKVEDVPRRKRAFSTNVTADNWMETIIKEKHRDLVEDNDDTDDFTYTKDRTYSAVTANVIGTSYYKYFRYAYNFRFGERTMANENLFENLQIVCQLLDASDLRNRALISDDFDDSLSDYVTCSTEVPRITLESDFAHSLLQMARHNFTFPINLNTIVGLRAFVVLFESDELVERKGPRNMFGQLLMPKEEPSTSDGARSTSRRHPALDQFRQRFISLFKNTAMLAKVSDLTVTKSGPRVKLKRASVFPRSLHAAMRTETATTSAAPVVSETIIICNNESQQRIENLLTSSDSLETLRTVRGNDNDWDVSGRPPENELTVLQTVPMDDYPMPIQSPGATDSDYDYELKTNSGTYQIKVLSDASDDKPDLAKLKRERDSVDKCAFETPTKQHRKN